MEGNLTKDAAQLVLQLGVILIAAKVLGEVVERLFRQPPVLGELLAGVIIGPFALGGLGLGPIGPLFPLAGGDDRSLIPVSRELYALGQIAAVILLFHAGLNTDLRRFLRFAPQATAVAAGGVALPFLLGDIATVLFGFAPSGPLDPHALFVGAILTATSVGITARVLDDLRSLDSPEGVTILGAAVVDDVIGILVLTVVVGIGVAGTVKAGDIVFLGAKAVGFWLALTGGGILLARFIVAWMGRFHGEGALLALALALAFLASAVAERSGLAMIIGAYSIGLALSQTDLAQRLHEPLSGVYHTLVPVFFVVMGMLVDVSAMLDALGFGLVIVVLAVLGKIVGCGLTAFGVGFNRRGAWRIGVGMLPRGEVALVIAGIGATAGVISEAIFGVSILMTVVTTFLAPPLLVMTFGKGGSGLRRSPAPDPTTVA